LVSAPVIPVVFSVTRYFVLIPIALVNATVGPLVHSVAVLHAVLVGADVFGTIDPFLFTVAFLDIVLELSFVLAAINMSVLSIAIGHIVFKLTSIDIAFGMPESALSFSLIKIPLAFVVSPICPVLDTISVSEFVDVLIVLRIGTIVIKRHPASVGRIPVTHIEAFAIANELAVGLILLLHLTSVNGVVWINEHVSVDQSWLI
jgi:hypothetical protein